MTVAQRVAGSTPRATSCSDYRHREGVDPKRGTLAYYHHYHLETTQLQFTEW